MQIVNRAITREEDVMGESHHIIPRSLGGTDIQENIVKLTHREHFIVHALLTKMCSDPKHIRSMAFAFISMKGSGSRRPYSNSRLYNSIKMRIRSEFSGQNNPFYGKGRFGEENHFYGKKHSTETRNRIKKSLVGKNIGEENHFYGKKHSTETRNRIRRRRLKPIIVHFTDGRIVRLEDRGELGMMLGKSSHLGHSLAKLSHVVGNKCHLWPKYGIERIIYEDHQNN